LYTSLYIEKIKKLKKKRDAILLVHNYQLGEVQDIADYLGDSLGLSLTAAKSDHKVIVFCGVRFMAETASILCPDKIVLIPDPSAGCPMANMITADELHSLKNKHPEAAVVSYVNTTAEIKAESDICCTSANADKIVNSLEASEIIFVPDKYLAHYVSTKTKKKIIPWNGYCPTHIKILVEHILEQKKLHPQAKVIVHPECTPNVINVADEVLSTGGMVRYARESRAKEIIVGTEIGIIYRLRQENPNKNFYAASNSAICPNMKLNTQEKVIWSLENMKHQINIPQNVQVKAKKALQKMLEIS
jgi:quinolinate synthase